jgi:hypothetical protein
MNKSEALNLKEMFSVAFKMMECSKKHCSNQKKKLMANKETADLYMRYTLEQDAAKKMQLFKELNKKNILYKYDTCIIKHCKVIMKELIAIIKIQFDKLPKSNPNYDKLHKMITTINAIIDTPRQISKKQYDIYVKDMNEIMSSIAIK